MSWLYPYSCSVTAVSDSNFASGSVIASNVETGSSTTVQMDIQDRTPEVAFAKYGIELKAPAEAYCAVASLASFGNGYIVVRGSYKYHVVAVVMAREEDVALAYGTLLLERVLI